MDTLMRKSIRISVSKDLTNQGREAFRRTRTPGHRRQSIA